MAITRSGFLRPRTTSTVKIHPLRGAFLSFQFPDSAEGGLLAWGRSKRVSAMTHKVIALEFVVPTALAIALGIVLSIGAVYLTDKCLGPIACPHGVGQPVR